MKIMYMFLPWKKNNNQITLAFFQLRSFGIFPLGASKTITAAVTFVTAPGGEPNDFNSVRLALLRVLRASFEQGIIHLLYRYV